MARGAKAVGRCKRARRAGWEEKMVEGLWGVFVGRFVGRFGVVVVRSMVW
jgi:hypothetical protein